MGLKSLILLNKNSKILYYNSSFLGIFNYNRYFYLYLFLNKIFNKFFNNSLIYYFLFNLKKIKIKSKVITHIKLFFGKLFMFIYQNWFILKVNFFIKKKNTKNIIKKFFLKNFIKKKKIIEL